MHSKLRPLLPYAAVETPLAAHVFAGIDEKGHHMNAARMLTVCCMLLHMNHAQGLGDAPGS